MVLVLELIHRLHAGTATVPNFSSRVQSQSDPQRCLCAARPVLILPGANGNWQSLFPWQMPAKRAHRGQERTPLGL